MKSLFDQTELSGLKLKNRFVRSATRDGFADKRGHMTPELLQRYENLAKGGVGTIITGHAFVTDKEDSKQPGQMGIYDDSFIEDYKSLTDAVHVHDCKIVLQVSCIGAQTFSSGGDKLIWGPSPVADLATNITPKEMDLGEIRFLQNAFAEAALRAKLAGFDGVQIHAAHGYVLNKFLNPFYNRRSDAYGGQFENRIRMLLETYEAMRVTVGADYPILVKVNCSDFMDGGMGFDEGRQLCRLLSSSGIDAIEVSGGSLSSPDNLGPIRTHLKENESYFSDFAAELAGEIRCPVIVVGGNRDFQKMKEILNSSQIEYFALCRPLILEEALINRWKHGDLAPSRCLSCNRCLGLDKTVCFLNANAED